MSDIESGAIETGQEKTNDELTQLKKETIKRIMDKIKEKNQGDIFLDIGEDMVADYLLDEGDDKINDFFLGMGINIFSKSADQLKDLREKIKNSNTKEELENLEKSVIESLSDSGNEVGQNTGSESQGETSQTNPVSSSQKDDINPGVESSIDSAKVGEAKDVPLKQRMERLFPKGVPTEEKEMKKYIAKIKVPIRTPDGKKGKMTLQIHKKLANEYKKIFEEICDKGIPVNPSSTGGYCWRKMRKGKKMSHHSYGTAIDVNRDVNGGVYGKTDKNSPYYNNETMVNIWKNHGFYRGGDWSKKSDDPMHFTYMNA